MKLDPKFQTATVAGETMVIPVGEAAQTFRGIIRLNETAKFIWDGLAAGQSEGEIVARLTEVYDVDAETAQRGV